MKTYKFKRGVLINGDCLDVLPKLKAESVDLVVADPPFNIGYEYDQYFDNLLPEEYYAWSCKWIDCCVRALKPTGSMFVVIGDEYAAELKFALDRKLHMRNWIIWYYTFGVYSKHKFGRDHAHILYYCKDPKQRTFRADDIKVPSRRQTLYQDKRADAKGRVPGDVWTFPRVCGTFKERNTVGHKCQLPESLVDRIVKVASRPGGLVLDPFAGTGTTLAVSKRLKRRFIGVELSTRYSRYIASRVRNVRSGADNSSVRK